MALTPLAIPPILLIVFMIYALMSDNHFLLQIPTVGLLGRVSCNYRESVLDDDNSRCKDVQNQQRLASLLGWKICFDTVRGWFLVPTAPCKEFYR